MITKFKIFEYLENFPLALGGFTIPKKLEKYYKDIEGNLSNTHIWKAKIILNNSGSGDLKKGDYDNVGYVMVNHNTSDIIPIARADEHHRGEDLLYHFWEKRLIDNMDYTPIFANGNNYCYYDSINDPQIKKDLNAFRNFLKFGGDSLPLNVTFVGADYRRVEFKINIKTFVDLNANFDEISNYVKTEGVLTEDAEDLINFLERISWYIKQYKMGKDKTITKSTIIDKVNNFFNKSYGQKVIDKIDFINMFNIKKNINKAIQTFDVDLIESTLLYHSGLKNNIHILLRKKDSRLKQFFGNLDLALTAFDKISAI